MMGRRILAASLIAVLTAGSGYLVYDYNLFAEKYTGAQMEILRNKARLKELEKQLKDVQLERSLVGRTIGADYIPASVRSKKTLILLATSQDCSPCTERELEIWKRFLDGERLEIPMTCMYYRFNTAQYGKYEDVYRSIFPFAYDSDGLYEHLGIDDTPIFLLIDAAGTVIYAHRPDVMHEEKTEEFLKMLVRMT